MRRDGRKEEEKEGRKDIQKTERKRGKKKVKKDMDLTMTIMSVPVKTVGAEGTKTRDKLQVGGTERTGRTGRTCPSRSMILKRVERTTK